MEGIMKIFETKEVLEESLCQQIKSDLESAITRNGKATILVSGGTTPKGLFLKLNQLEIDWKNVIVGLVDERFVPITSEFSNEKLVKENLLIQHASTAQFVSMVQNSENEIENLLLVQGAYSVFNEATIVLLGMGDDGHTASIFPNDEESAEAIISAKNILSTKAPSEPKHRITCSANLLKSAKKRYLLFTGIKKQEILKEAEAKNYPIRHFLNVIDGIYCTN
jgi:6-phosphogluconolactonase